MRKPKAKAGRPMRAGVAATVKIAFTVTPSEAEKIRRFAGREAIASAIRRLVMEHVR